MASASWSARPTPSERRWLPMLRARCRRPRRRSRAGWSRRPRPGRGRGRRRCCFAAGRLAAFGESVGLELAPGVLLSEAVIERLVLAGCDGLSPASVRTLRSNLRALARTGVRYPEPEPVPLPRERAKAPYSLVEIDGYLRLAACLSTQRRRMRASALVCLGAGAGVIAGELRDVRGTDVVLRSGGVVVVVGGRRARSVPLLARYHGPLLEAARPAEPNRRPVHPQPAGPRSHDQVRPGPTHRDRPTDLRPCFPSSSSRAISRPARAGPSREPVTRTELPAPDRSAGRHL